MFYKLTKEKEVKILPTNSLEEAHEKYANNPRSNVRIRAGVFAGGGAKGIISLVMARAIEKELEKINKQREGIGKKRIEISFVDTLDSLAGTSTGAIIACLLALRKSTDPRSPDYKRPKYSVNDVLRIYLKSLPKIFGLKQLALIKAFTFPFKKEKFQAIRKSFFTTDGLMEVLKDLGLEDVEFTRKNFLVPITVVAGNLAKKEGLFFRTEDGLKNKISDVLRASTAATPHFPAHEAIIKVRNADGTIGEEHVLAGDGAFYDNSPVLEVFSEIIDPKKPVIGKGGKYHINKGVDTSFTMIVFGTGDLEEFKQKRKKISGLTNLASGIQLLLSASSKTSQKLLESIFEFYNEKHALDRQSASRMIELNAKMDKTISITSHSKKSLRALWKYGFEGGKTEENKKKIEAYASYAFVEKILRKCDRDKQKQVVGNNDFNMWYRAKQERIIDLEAERAILSSPDADDISRIMHIAEEKKLHDVRDFVYSIDARNGKCKQREIKRAVRYINTRETSLEQQIDELHAQNALAFEGAHGVMHHDTHLRDVEMASGSNWGLCCNNNGFEKIIDPVKQENVYTQHFHAIMEENPEAVPNRNSSIVDRVYFSRGVVRTMHAEKSQETLDNAPMYHI